MQITSIDLAKVLWLIVAVWACATGRVSDPWVLFLIAAYSVEIKMSWRGK